MLLDFVNSENFFCIHFLINAEQNIRSRPKNLSKIEHYIKMSAANLFEFATIRSSHPEVFCKKGALKNFTKFTAKNTFARVSFLASLLKKILWKRCFPVNFANFLRTSFSTDTSGGYFCTIILDMFIQVFLEFISFLKS